MNLFRFTLPTLVFVLCSHWVQADQGEENIPPEAVQGMAGVDALLKTLEQCSYIANYQIETYRKMDLRGPGNAPQPSPELKDVARSTGVINFKRDENRQLVVVTPGQTDPKHQTMTIGAKAIYSLENGIVRNFSERDQVIRIDREAGMQRILPRPYDLISIESTFSLCFSDRWMSNVTGVTPENVKIALEKEPLKQKIVSGIAQAPDITVEESITVGHAETVFGKVHGWRSVTYSKDHAWLPAKIKLNFSGATSREFEISWVKLGKSDAPNWFPQRITALSYSAAERKPKAPQVLMQRQVLDVKLGSIFSGAAVRDWDFTFAAPNAVRTYDTTDPSKIRSK